MRTHLQVCRHNTHISYIRWGTDISLRHTPDLISMTTRGSLDIEYKCASGNILFEPILGRGLFRTGRVQKGIIVYKKSWGNSGITLMVCIMKLKELIILV